MDREKLLEILKLYPGYDKLYGPYARKQDNRKHIVLTGPGEIRLIKKTISYPKALMEVHLGRRLTEIETVDHHDRDYTNDSIDNLVVRDLSLHVSDDALRVSVAPVICPECGATFVPTRGQYNRRLLNKNMAGPFCSKSCAGKYGKRIQLGGDKIPPTPVVKTYYRRDKKR